MSMSTLLARPAGLPRPIPSRSQPGELARHAQAHDASHFLLLPSAVVTPATRPRWPGCSS